MYLQIAPALSSLDRGPQLRKHDRLDLDLRKQQFTGEMSLQCRLTDRLTIIAHNAKANTILRHAAGNKKLDDGSVFIRRDKWWPTHSSLKRLFILLFSFIFHALSLVLPRHVLSIWRRSIRRPGPARSWPSTPSRTRAAYLVMAISTPRKAPRMKDYHDEKTWLENADASEKKSETLKQLQPSKA